MIGQKTFDGIKCAFFSIRKLIALSISLIAWILRIHGNTMDVRNPLVFEDALWAKGGVAEIYQLHLKSILYVIFSVRKSMEV